MTAKQLFFNKYSKTAALVGAGSAIALGIVNKKPMGKIAGNAIYLMIGGILVGTVVNSIMKTNKTTMA